MSTAAPPKPEADPLVIAHVKLNTLITLGSTATDSWSLTESPSSLIYGRVRVEPWERGLMFFYKAGDVYQEHTVYESNLADVCRVPLSSLPPAVRETWKKAEKAVRR